MAFTFDSTVSGASTNSYATVANFDDYADSMLFLDLNLSTEQKQKVLAMAFRIIESLTFNGMKTVSTQKALFPRTGLIDKEGYSIDGSTIPQALKDAQCELALFLLDNEVRYFEEGEDNRVTESYSAGALTFRYRELANPDKLPLRVQQLLKDIGINVWVHKRMPIQFRL